MFTYFIDNLRKNLIYGKKAHYMRQYCTDNPKVGSIFEHNGKKFQILEIQFTNKEFNNILVKEITNMKKYGSAQCQKCGEFIGWFGRFNGWFYGLFGIKNIIHKCKFAKN